MINRLQLIRNIGQFDSVSGAANIPLARLTVVYSENGRGKTTIAAVLRSLATGDPMPIAERKRLAAQHPPHVVLECGGGPNPAVFENNAWNRTLADLVVFDDVFVDENVHSGLAVQAHQRQNLHELILGAPAVALSRELQALVGTIETHNTELRAKERAIPAADRGPYSVDDFCALTARPDIDQVIQEAERALAAARDQDAIRTTLPLDLLILPPFDLAAIEAILEQDLPALDAATLVQVRAHLTGLGEGGEPWVAAGMRRIPQGQGTTATGTCPFCAQDLLGSPVIQHYRAYFSDAYAALKRTVSDALGAVNRAHGGDAPAGFERAVRVAVERRHTLSAGDRNTLALAFFFASLDQDERLVNKVVVIDDPISSLDEHRALTTVQEVRHIAERAAQVIVLSHNRPFLCRLWEGADSTARAALEVVRDGAGSTLREWDVAEDSITEHDRRHAKLTEFLASGAGDRREVARSIRPHLEAFLRVACPEHFQPGELLGRFIGVCERRAGTAQEILDAASIQELRDLNEYASRYHHQGWETEPINDGSLRGFVERALRFARR
jgi:Uncharacterized protein conserved in bacteria